MAEPTRNFRNISMFSNERNDVSALNAQFHAATVMLFLFTVLHIHCVYAVHTLAPRHI